MHRSVIATALAALAVTGANAATPTHSEAIQAIRDFCPGLRQPISKVRCEGFGADEPTEAVCTYRVGGKKPRKDKTYLAVDRDGWSLIDQPTYCPGMKQGTN